MTKTFLLAFLFGITFVALALIAAEKIFGEMSELTEWIFCLFAGALAGVIYHFVFRKK